MQVKAEGPMVRNISPRLSYQETGRYGKSGIKFLTLILHGSIILRNCIAPCHRFQILTKGQRIHVKKKNKERGKR